MHGGMILITFMLNVIVFYKLVWSLFRCLHITDNVNIYIGKVHTIISEIIVVDIMWTEEQFGDNCFIATRINILTLHQVLLIQKSLHCE
jgi:hypothetical protein